MTLFIATMILAVGMILEGGLWIVAPRFVEKSYKSMLRSRIMTLFVFGAAAAWFLWHILHLGEADFGNYKQLLLFLFSLIILGSILFVRDFLAVRGWAILMLLICKVLLDAAYMVEAPGKVFMVGMVYLIVLASLYFGTVPYKMRDLLEWSFRNKKRPRIIGGVELAYGLLLLGVALNY